MMKLNKDCFSLICNCFLYFDKNNRLVSKGCKLVGCGSAVPKLEISNDDLAKIVDTNDEWISARTGIRNRRVLTGNLVFLFML